MFREPHGAVRPWWRQPVHGNDAVACSESDLVGTMPMFNGDGGADKTRRGRVMVPPEGDQHIHSDLAFNVDDGRERCGRQCHQRLGRRQIADNYAIFESLVSDLDPPLVERRLGVLG